MTIAEENAGEMRSRVRSSEGGEASIPSLVAESAMLYPMTMIAIAPKTETGRSETFHPRGAAHASEKDIAHHDHCDQRAAEPIGHDPPLIDESVVPPP